MRLKKEHIETIKKYSKEVFGSDTDVYLFGSRVDDSKKGGDIDIYLETSFSGNVVEKKIKLLGLLHQDIGEQKIDIVINNFRKNKFIYDVAKNEGVRL